MTVEVIFLGLPGPTHHYGGLAKGNIASAGNAGQISHPQEAALQVLALARQLLALGQRVAFLPPQPRPDISTLKHQGIAGNTPEEIIANAGSQNPALLSKVYSSAFMWAANAATVSPGCDSADKRLHLTPANLSTHLHRAIDAPYTTDALRHIFAGTDTVIHPPLPATSGDEGAANYMRLGPLDGPALHVFIYGRGDNHTTPKKFPARQTLAACQAIAAQHRLNPQHVLFVRQNPEAIDLGVFHNDVIALNHHDYLLAHEHAFAEGIAPIIEAYQRLHQAPLKCRIITQAELSIEEAVATYFFNSQIVTKPDGKFAILAPEEVKHHKKSAPLMESLGFETHYLDLRQSMQNGGGPACLRLRIWLSENELAKLVTPMADAALLTQLETSFRQYYSESLKAAELADPQFYHQAQTAQQAIAAILR